MLISQASLLSELSYESEESNDSDASLFEDLSYDVEWSPMTEVS
ncbi:hypothetical protein [Mucilaginibacter phenanthrenivorans]|nr:hypothetical protein [Mucilaginibacter phenanthrenivorans]